MKRIRRAELENRVAPISWCSYAHTHTHTHTTLRMIQEACTNLSMIQLCTHTPLWAWYRRHAAHGAMLRLVGQDGNNDEDDTLTSSFCFCRTAIVTRWPMSSICMTCCFFWSSASTTSRPPRASTANWISEVWSCRHQKILFEWYAPTPQSTASPRKIAVVRKSFNFLSTGGHYALFVFRFCRPATWPCKAHIYAHVHTNAFACTLDTRINPGARSAELFNAM